MAMHSSIFAGRIPWTEEPGNLQSLGLYRVRHDWSDLAHAHTHTHTHTHTLAIVYSTITNVSKYKIVIGPKLYY